MTPRPLTDKQRRFVDEYLVDLNATQAAIRAGYSKRTANEIGAENLAKPSIAGAVGAALAIRSERTGITADAVLRRLWLVATADPRELIEYRRTACRYCYGAGFRHQFTQNELARARAQWEAAQKKSSPETFDEHGGSGFNATKPPHPGCPECFGEGVERVFVRDTRHFTDSARVLYAGVKVTKDGIEVKMQDQGAALVNVGKHLGMFGDRVEEPESADERASRIRAALSAMDDATLGQAA